MPLPILMPAEYDERQLAGHLTDGAEQVTGIVYLQDIGAPRKLIEEML